MEHGDGVRQFNPTKTFMLATAIDLINWITLDGAFQSTMMKPKTLFARHAHQCQLHNMSRNRNLQT